MPDEGDLDPATEAERQQLPREVLRDELDYVRDRRVSHGLADDAAPEEQPEIHKELVGLAFSGGGIRSATFNLGLLQALHRGGLLRWVDYLSTVSGGGFIGSALTALASDNARKHRPQRPDSFPFEHREQAREPAALRWLRGHSEYLAPKGLFDYLKAFALFTRGIALNLMLLLPILLTLGLLGTLAYDDALYAHGRKEAWATALAGALADRWGSEPTDETPVEDVVEALATGQGVEPARLYSALEAYPPLVVRKPSLAPEEDDAATHHFARLGNWVEVVSRLAGVEEARPWERPHAVQAGRLLTYSHLNGLRLRRIGNQPGSGHYFWTDRSPVSAAAIHPGGGLIGATGYDGSVFAWVIAREVKKSVQIHESRHPGPAPLTDVRFSAGGQWMVALGDRRSPLVWRIIGATDGSPPRLEPLRVHEGSPVCEACSVQLVAEAAFDGWIAEPDEARLVPGRLSAKRLTGLPRGTLRLANRFSRQFATEEGEVSAIGFPLKDPLAESSERGPPLWDPEVLQLETSFRILMWLLLAFVLLYPLLILFRTPLRGIAELVLTLSALVAGGLALLSRAIGKRLRRRPPTPDPPEGPAPDQRGKRGRGVLAILALLFLLYLGSLVVHNLLPWDAVLGEILFWGGMLLLGWWLLSTVLLAPLLRFRGSRPDRPFGSRSLTGATIRLLLLLLPSGWVALDLIEPLGRVPAAIWLAVVVLLAWPLVRLARPGRADTGPRPGDRSSSRAARRRIRHRRLAGRLYIAAGLLPWLVVLKAIAGGRGGYVAMAITALFEDGSPLAVDLARLACGLFLTGLGFVYWRVYARLVSGRAESTIRRTRRPRGSWATRISGFEWRNAYERAFGLALLALFASGFLEVQTYLVYYYRRLLTVWEGDWTRLLIAFSFLVIVLAAMSLPLFKGVGKKVVLLVLGLLGPLLPFLLYLRMIDRLVFAERWAAFRRILHPPDALDGLMLAFFLLVTIVAVAYLLGKLVDANLTSMHGFYRDRLSQAYLVGEDTDGRIGPEEELALTDICPRGSGAPYHLINASLNMQGEGEGALRWRNSDFFVFSKHWCGGPQTSYCRTGDLGYLAPDLHLGSAMAVSGAAASPNMGSLTSRTLVMLMTLLNVRLGLWLPNPRRVSRLAELGEIEEVRGLGGRLRRWLRRLLARPSGYYLVHEMFSRLHARRPYVNLSDGGHLENTGAYELLRRRCRLILIGDADADPEVRFGPLAALIRFARIDLGIEIEIDLGPLRSDDGQSDQHWAVGTITYPPDGEHGPDTGYLVYVKTSLTDDEGEAIREYRARRPDFPHESTADQSFEEDQFEAYRALGFHIGGKLLASLGELGSTAEAELKRWLEPIAPAERPAD